MIRPRMLLSALFVALLGDPAAAQAPGADPSVTGGSKAPAASSAPAPTGSPPSPPAASASQATPATTAAPGSGGDPARGEAKTSMCTGCHGIEGWRTAFPEVYSVPRIGGQHEAYIVQSLRAYRSGERLHPSMRAIAKDLSDRDIADLAAYYARGRTRTAGK